MIDTNPYRRSSASVVLTLLGLLLAALSQGSAQTDTTDRSRPVEPTTTTPRSPFSPFVDPFPYEGYRHSVEFDSVTGTVRVRESLFGQPFSQPQTMTLDQYVARRQEEQERIMWEERARSYNLDSAKKGRAGGIKDIFGEGFAFKPPIPTGGIFGLFGSPTVSISVNGSVNVSAGWQWDDNNLTSISAYNSTQSAPFFNQNIQVAVSGKVGEKLKLNADFDTQRTFDIDNQLKIGFGGGPASDDDIIQSVEAGNVSLQSASSLIGGSQTLFGIKSSFKFGPLFLTTIASQKRGERKTVSVTGGSVKSQISLKPYDYAPNHFWLDTTYKNFYDIFYRNQPPAATVAMAPWNITEIELYKQVQDGSLPSQFRGIAYADLPPVPAIGRYGNPWTTPAPADFKSGEVQAASFVRLDPGRDFEVDRQLGTLTIKGLESGKIYAVAYRTAGAGTFGELSNTRSDNANDIAILKLVYVNNLQPTFKSLWARQMKNIYSVGKTNVDVAASRITITYGVPPDTSTVLKIPGNPRLVEVLGVDRVNSSKAATPDGEFDINSPYFFNPVTGEITFPSTEPFRQGLRNSPLLGGNADPFIVNSIYDQTREQAQRDNSSAARYTISGEVAGSGTGNKITLGAFNLAPNSIKVVANGEVLTEGLDYRVDPVFGEVTLISPKANTATGNIQVEYEQNDFFTVAQKTLFGLRADYDLLNKRKVKSKLGMTLLRFGQTTPTNKVQIYAGEEPMTNLAIGFDGWVDYTADFLTRAIDALPLIDTKEPSSIKVGGEWALMSPNPNTKQSLVSSDGDVGSAYIDDFESGAKRQIQLGLHYALWRHASSPLDSSLGITDSSRLSNKGHFWWYNRQPANTPVIDIWPGKFTSTYAQQASILDVQFDPGARGIYNPNVGYEAAPPLNEAWGGMMRSLSFFTTNLDEENIDYIEVTLNAREVQDLGNTKVYLDLGQISEDVIPNLDLNTEDGVNPNNTQQDDVLNEGEDVGIDRINQEQERAQYGLSEEDPARDDYQFSAYTSDNYQDYRYVNGLEKNVGRESGPFPDSEDLNGNKSLDLDNSYFRYEINLDPNPVTNPQIVGGGDNLKGWRQYRIPIRTGYREVGNPSFGNVQFARLVIKGPAFARIRFAEFNLVGSDWRNSALAVNDTARDPKLEVAYVNVEDNAGPPDYYTIPPGVEREEDYSNPEILKNEQSLSVRVKDLARGESRSAVRVRPRSFDVFNYKKMKFFLHGSGDMDVEPIPGAPAKVMALIRFGWDSLNYYEYRVPLLRDWHEYTINFDDLAAIKLADGILQGDGSRIYQVPGQPTAKFALRGLPSLTRIQFVSFGVENNAYPGALTTTMWVNELRVVEPEDAADWAATMQGEVKLADLGTINYNAQRSNPNFHRLEDRFGDRVETTTWAVNTSFALTKFLPEALKGSSIPFTFNHAETVRKPRYISESDVDVNAAGERIISEGSADPNAARARADSLRLATQTLSVVDAFAFSNFRLAWPGQSWYVRDIFNKFTFGFDYRQERQRSPLIEQRFDWSWRFKGGYQTPTLTGFDIQPFKKIFETTPVLSFWKDFKVNLLPQTFGVGTEIKRGRITEKLRNVEFPSSVIRDFEASRTAQFRWPITDGGILNISTDYTLDVRSSLAHLEIDSLRRQRGAGDIADDLFFNEGRLFNFGRDQAMSQSFTFNTRPRIPFIPNIDRFVTPSARYKVDYKWNDELSQISTAGSSTKSAQWNSNATLGLNISLRLLANALWGDPPTGKADTTSESAIASILRYLIKVPLLDFEKINLSFNQNNSSKNQGILGSTGISNLWGRSLFFRSESPDFGPGAAYQLGLTSDPHARLKFGLKSAFPFIDVQKEAGIRMPGIYVTDFTTQENNLQASTERTLWPGASITLNWNVKWGYNRSTPLTTSELGEVIPGIETTTHSLSRSYLSLPDFLLFGAFNNDIDGVVDEYARRKAELAVPQLPANPNAADSAAFGQAQVNYNKELTRVLSRTFEEQLEALNWLPGEISRYLPRLNWQFNWNGLEKLPFMSSWASNASIRHIYNGKFTYNYEVAGEEEKPQTQTVTRGFAPLVQLTVSGKPDVFDGTATGSLSYNTTTDFSLITAAKNEISKEVKNEAQLQLSYQKRGFNLPLFGLNLKNEIEFQTTFTYSRNNRKRFNLTDFKPEGNNNGSTKISFRPSVRYSLSNALDALAFVSYEATIPDEEGSREISRSTTKVGVELRLRISGGR